MRVPTHLYTQVGFPFYVFFTRVEFGTLVHEVATSLASDRHGQHHAHCHQISLLSFTLG